MKQAGWIWNKTMDSALRSWGFTPLQSELCIYYRILNGDIVIATIHVDDFLSIASLTAANQAFKDQM